MPPGRPQASDLRKRHEPSLPDLVEHLLICSRNEKVIGSIPIGGSTQQVSESQLGEFLSDVVAAKEQLSALARLSTAAISLAVESQFAIKPGTRVTRTDVEAHRGDLPVYSCFTRAEAVKGRVGLAWAQSVGMRMIHAFKPAVTCTSRGSRHSRSRSRRLTTGRSTSLSITSSARRCCGWSSSRNGSWTRICGARQRG